MGPSPYGAARTSRQRERIAEAVASLATAFTVEELTARVRELAPEIALATVYRAVGAMEAAGHLEAVGERDGARLYAACDASEHHHHAVCTSCGRVEPTPCAVEQLAAPAGFRVTAHDVTLYGVCGRCAEARGA